MSDKINWQMFWYLQQSLARNPAMIIMDKEKGEPNHTATSKAIRKIALNLSNQKYLESEDRNGKRKNYTKP